MSAVSWYIPLYVLAVAIAVVPVAYGTIKHRQWEEAEAAHPAAPTHHEAPKVSHIGPRLEEARHEALALLERLEHLQKFVAREEAVVDPQ
jgi:hypothetical protein